MAKYGNIGAQKQSVVFVRLREGETCEAEAATLLKL
jgi:hypothetical protein